MSKITVEQIGELVEQSKGENPRVTREILQAFLRNPNAFLRASVYSATVDYGKSVEEMVVAGNYDWKNKDINSKNFPVSGEGTVNVNFELIHLNKGVSSEDALTHLEENGMRPPTIEELLVFGSSYPEIQREFPVICLGSSWVSPGGDRDVPYLSRDGSERGLSLGWFGGDWDECCRFLAVRK